MWHSTEFNTEQGGARVLPNLRSSRGAEKDGSVKKVLTSIATLDAIFAFNMAGIIRIKGLRQVPLIITKDASRFEDPCELFIAGTQIRSINCGLYRIHDVERIIWKW